jgi:hypothetical protein
VSFTTTVTVVNAANDESSIEYWTNYAILPKKCIKYNSNDQIMYSMYEQYSNHCTDTPTGVYVTSVPTFVNAYLEQLADNAADSGEEFNYPNAYNYLSCTLKEVNGVNYYLQLGCNDDSSSMLAVNIYSDAQCTTPSVVNGYDDANVQIDFSITFNKCMPCVIWADKNDDQIDDQYFENKQMNAPLCSAMWEYKQTCNDKCQLLAKDSNGAREGWNKADKVLLSILSLFGKNFTQCNQPKDDLKLNLVIPFLLEPLLETKNRLGNAHRHHQKASKNVQQGLPPRTSCHLRRWPTTIPHPWHLCFINLNHYNLWSVGVEENYVGAFAYAQHCIVCLPDEIDGGWECEGNNY